MLGQKKKAEEQAEKRAMNFQRERGNFSAIISPEDEKLYHTTKAEKEDFLKWQQNSDTDLEELKHLLKRHSNSPEGWRQQQIITGYDKDGQALAMLMPPLINELGIQMIESEIKPLINKNLFNTKLEEDRIKLLAKRTMITIVDNLKDNYYSYGVAFQDLDHVVNIVESFIVPALYRAHQGFTKKQDTTIHKSIEARTDVTGGDGFPKAGLWDIFKK